VARCALMLALMHVVTLSALAARAQRTPVDAPAIGTDVGARALALRTSCDAAWTAELERALEVELSTSRQTDARCVSVDVGVEADTCDEVGAARASVQIGDGASVTIEYEGGGLRALSLLIAEQVARSRGVCEAALASRAAEPWRDPRPLASDADRELYYGPYEFGRRLTRRPADGTWLLRARAAPFLDLERLGAGLLGDVAVAAWLAEGLWVRAELGPMGLAAGAGPGIGQLGGSLLVGYDTGILALAVGGGLGTANGIAGAEVLGRVELYLRFGFEPSLFAAALVSIAVDDRRVDLGLVSARFSVPVDRALAITWGGEVSLAFASGRLDLGLQAWIDGDLAESRGVAIEAGVGASALAFVPRCALGPCEREWTLAVGPSVLVGLVVRGGP
jgi:hypothetical protein